MLYEKVKLEEGEKVLKEVRRHWFIITSELFAVFLMFLFPLFILFILALFPSTLSEMEISLPHFTAIITFVVSAWSIITLLSGFMIWTHYYLDLWIITDRRIIAIDQIHFFNRNISVFRLERMQDIEVTIKGLLPTFLDFGTINAQTAGNFESNFKQTGMPDPRGLQALIQQAMDQRLRELQNLDPRLQS